MTAAAFWWVNSVTVQTFLGNGRSGQTWTAPTSVSCWVEDVTEVVRGPNGEETTSSARVHAALSEAGKFTPSSKVTLPGGRTEQVIKLARFDSGSLNLGVDHIEVSLT